MVSLYGLIIWSHYLVSLYGLCSSIHLLSLHYIVLVSVVLSIVYDHITYIVVVSVVFMHLIPSNYVALVSVIYFLIELQWYHGLGTSGFRSKKNSYSLVRTAMISGNSIFGQKMSGNLSLQSYMIQNHDTQLQETQCRNILRYLDTQYPNFGCQEIEFV